MMAERQASVFAFSTIHVHAADTVQGEKATTNIHVSGSLSDAQSLTPVSFALVFLTKFMCALISRFGPFFAPYLAIYFGATTEQVLDGCQFEIDPG